MLDADGLLLLDLQEGHTEGESLAMILKLNEEKPIGIKHDQTEVDFSSQGLGVVDAILVATDLLVSGMLTKIS